MDPQKAESNLRRKVGVINGWLQDGAIEPDTYQHVILSHFTKVIHAGLPDAIQVCKDLRSDGVISDDIYQRFLAIILDGMAAEAPLAAPASGSTSFKTKLFVPHGMGHLSVRTGPLPSPLPPPQVSKTCI